MAKDILKFHARHLAGAAARGRLRAAQARLRPRLPADERAQDVQVASATCSTRSRSSTSSGPTRCGTTASARSPSARTARCRRQAFEDALHDRARQRLRQPREPHAEHAAPLRGRDACPTPSPTRRSPPTSTSSPQEVCDLLDRAEVTQALERIWQRVRRLNRYVEEQAPWKLAKDPEPGRPPRDGAALARRGPARGHRPAAPLPAREHRRSCSPRSATSAPTIADAAFGAGRPGRADRRARRRCSRSRSDRQPHPPRLDARARTPTSSPARATPGVTKLLDDRHGRRVSRARARGGRARSTATVFAAVGRHPN